MGTAPIRKLYLNVGEIVEVDGRRYEVVALQEGAGLALEPAITPMAELHKRWGTKPVSQEKFDRLSADLPSDDEG